MAGGSSRFVGTENRDEVAEFHSENESSICETVKEVKELVLALLLRLKLKTSGRSAGERSARTAGPQGRGRRPRTENAS